jgi:hypothetical protein
MSGRTFKCFPRIIELRAYVPNIRADHVERVVLVIGAEMDRVLGIHCLDKEITICSNRAGLHLAYHYKPEDGSNRASSCLVENANCDYEKAVKSLEAAGWKECEGA